MSFNSTNYEGRCSQCGSYGGCSCGTGYDTSCYTPDYSPISQTNNISPTVEGSTGTGGSSAGGSSSSNGNSSYVNVHIPKNVYAGCGDNCLEGVKKILSYLYDKSLDETFQTSSICIYGDTIPSRLSEISNCQGNTLISLATIEEIQNLSICESVIKSNNTVVSMCVMNIIRFKFINTPNNDADLKKNFKFYNDCSCSCGNGMAEALCFAGFSNLYDLRLNDVLVESDGTILTYPATLRNLSLVAFDNNIAIFSNGEPDDDRAYFAIPTCSISILQPTI